MNDDKIQELIEKGGLENRPQLSATEEIELKRYEQLFAVLKDEPNIKIPSNFASNIIDKLQGKRDKKQNIFLNTLVLSLIVIGALGISSIITNGSLTALVDTFYQYRWICFFMFFLFLIIHIADHKMLVHGESISQKE